jgi:MinD superfamily P-loop ATPase
MDDGSGGSAKGIRIRVSVGNDDVALVLTEPVSHITLDAVAAIELADKIREAAYIILASDT